MIEEAMRVVRKRMVLEYAKGIGNAAEACREFGVPKSTFYEWKKAYDEGGVKGLVRKKPTPKSHPRSLPPEVVEKVIHLRQQYHLGPQRITWYLERYHGIQTSCSCQHYHGIQTSCSTVYRTL
jgi:transposase-like protein